MGEWSEVPTTPLESLVDVDPEAIPSGASPQLEFLYIDISSVAEGRLTLPRQRVALKDAPSRARRIVRNDDVVMSTVRPNLKAFARCALPSELCVASTGFAVLRPRGSNDSRFVLNAILSESVARQIERLVAGERGEYRGRHGERHRAPLQADLSRELPRVCGGCARGDVRTGRMFVTERAALYPPRWLVNFPTKEHWKNPTRIEWIESGLRDLSTVIRNNAIRNNAIRSIAIPALGCGNGGLDWALVRPLIDSALRALEDIDVQVYEPM
jgi:hypothetical protein